MISKETILLKTHNGLDVFRHFLPGPWRPGKNFLNPFYNDKNASCYIYKDKTSGIYKIKDFGDERYSGDCFDLVGLLYGLDCRGNFQEILQLIADKLSLGLESKAEGHVSLFNSKAETCEPKEGHTKKEQKKNIPESLVYKEFSKRELGFWGGYGIRPHILREFNVRSIHSFKAKNSDGVSYGFNSHPGEPIFGYCQGGFIKIYRPGSKNRFLYLGEKPSGYVFGMKHLPARGNVLFITGGEKDVMSLAARGFYGICFNSENAMIPKQTVYKLSTRFRHIILLYDMDSAGMKASEKRTGELKEFGVKRILLPLPGSRESKDVSDYFKEGFSAEDLKKLAPDCWLNKSSRT